MVTLQKSKMKNPRYPSLYQINTRVWLTALSGELGRRATLDDIPEKALVQLRELGFDWLWFLSVWTTGPQGQKISRENPEWRNDFEKTLTDLKDEDIAGSGFAIAAYHVHPDLGGDDALKRLRQRLKKLGFKLMLDFVPNHMGPDHPWVKDHPAYFVSGTVNDLEREPLNYARVHEADDLILAYGRDPYFSGWPDTFQLDYSNPATVEAMSDELFRISGQCDGVRCDMAMLILPEIFEKTWGRSAQPFWNVAIKRVREQKPDFCFMAEVYWEMEWTLQQQGFDYAYDKRLYDRLVEAHTRPVREHFHAGLDYQDKLARFLENHDEPRAAATFDEEMHKAAAVITFLSPGLRFFHQGQFTGRTKRISPHLIRAPLEPVNMKLQKFYEALLTVIQKPVFRNGNWSLLECTSAWGGNNTWDSFISFAWTDADNNIMLVSVNYSSQPGQCYVRLPFPGLANKLWKFNDLVSEAIYERQGNDLLAGGLYLDIPAWSYHIFEIRKI